MVCVIHRILGVLLIQLAYLVSFVSLVCCLSVNGVSVNFVNVRHFSLNGFFFLLYIPPWNWIAGIWGIGYWWWCDFLLIVQNHIIIRPPGKWLTNHASYDNQALALLNEPFLENELLNDWPFEMGILTKPPSRPPQI